jgi:2-oxoglutarate ferredoxin oxidoreductase subunit gamma
VTDQRVQGTPGPMARQDVRLSGFGGQGIVLAGYLLGKAAAIHAGREAVFTQSYGPEARGGACAAHVSIADEPIEYPYFEDADCLVAMSQEAYTTYRLATRPSAMVIVDADLVTGGGDEVHRVPFTRIAEELGQRIVSNVVMLGYVTGLTGIVPRAAMEETIRTGVRARAVELNLQAFSRGFELAHTAAGVVV